MSFGLGCFALLVAKQQVSFIHSPTVSRVGWALQSQTQWALVQENQHFSDTHTASRVFWSFHQLNAEDRDYSQNQPGHSAEDDVLKTA